MSEDDYDWFFEDEYPDGYDEWAAAQDAIDAERAETPIYTALCDLYQFEGDGS